MAVQNWYNKDPLLVDNNSFWINFSFFYKDVHLETDSVTEAPADSDFEFPQNLSIFSASVKVCNCGLGLHADQTAEMVPSTQQRLYATHII